MTFRVRVTAWCVLSCAVLIALMVFTAHRHLEEELRKGHTDPTHPEYENWKLHNSYSEDEIQDILDELTETWLMVAGPTIAISIGAGLLLARRALKPIHDINNQISTMRPNSLRGGIVIPESDQTFSDLVNHLNSLLDRAGTAYQEMAGFSAKVGHELRTPLMLLRMKVEHAPDGIPPLFQEELQDELSRLSRFVERSLLAAKAEQGRLEPAVASVDLSQLLKELTETYQLLASERELKMSTAINGQIDIMADPDLLRQMLHGLLENAMRYAKSNVDVTFEISGGVPELAIRNDFNVEEMPTAGLGLGLRLVQGICSASGFVLHLDKSETNYLVRIRFTPHPVIQSQTM